MTSQTFDSPTPAGNNKKLWAAIAVLGVAVLAMGATLIRIQTQPVEPRIAIADVAGAAPAASAAASAAATPPSVASSDTIITETAQEATSAPAAAVASPAVKVADSKPKPAPAHTSKAPKATHNAANSHTDSAITTTPQPVQAPIDEPAVARAPAEPIKPVCDNCGTVERVTAVEQQGSGTGLGAIAGGVLGAVVGNQVGGGDGRKLATVLGAVGGGLAGNSVEKNMKKTTYYRVQVRMDNGGIRTIEQSEPAMLGAQVLVEGNSIRIDRR
ncbi:MAG: glycine zipper 2TM domain-containing protein [Rhodoferax sp.]|nr:glycine zipper 2TM domain-containing protein [Rhodoferax sp.]